MLVVTNIAPTASATVLRIATVFFIAPSFPDSPSGFRPLGGDYATLRGMGTPHQVVELLSPRPVWAKHATVGHEPRSVLEGPGTRAPRWAQVGVGRNTGIESSSSSSRNTTSTAMPTATAPGSQSTTLVITRGPSSSSTMAAT